MSNDKDSARAVATGLDFKLRENSDALIRYLTSSKKVALQYQPSVREDGSLVVYFSPSNGLSASEVASLLSKHEHVVQGAAVYFSLLSDLECPSGPSPRGIREIAPNQLSRNLGNGRSGTVGRGRGIRKPTQSDSPNLSSSTLRQGMLHYISGKQSSHSFDAPYDRGMGCDQSSGGLHKIGHGISQSTEEGLDIIIVQGLPPHATKEGLLSELQLKARRTQSDVLYEFDFVHWEEGQGEARLRAKDMKAVFALWKNRHKSPLKYDGYVLSWDVAVSETYEEQRILVEGLSQDITPYKLLLHIRGTGCVSDGVQMWAVFLEDGSKALINFDDTIVDYSLVKELNETGSEYEGTGEKCIQLVYSLIPSPRSIRLTGLDSTIDKGAIRNYINTFHHEVRVSRPLLVNDISFSGDHSGERCAIIEFRTVEDCQELLVLPELPVLGPNGHHPAVELYWKYPNPDSASPQFSETLSPGKGTEDSNAFEVVPDDPVVFDYIWSSPKHMRRFKSILDCDEIEWNGHTVTIPKPCHSEKEYTKKFYNFTEEFCCKQLLVSDAKLWEKSLKFVELEMATRSCEGKLIFSKEDLKILFVGLKMDLVPLHQYCCNVFSGWRTQLEEETAETQVVISFPSFDHLSLVQRSPLYPRIVEQVDAKRHGSYRACLELKGPRNLVYESRDLLLEIMQTIKSVQVFLDGQIIEFIRVVGLEELNKLFENMKTAALAVEVEQTAVRLLLFPEARDAAVKLAKETYTVVLAYPIGDKEVQRFMRSEEYSVFVTSLCKDVAVKLDTQYEDIKASEKRVHLSVVGRASLAADAAKRLKSFLSKNVVYTEQHVLGRPGLGQFIRLYEADGLNQLKMADVKSEVDLSQEDVIILRSTKPGLRRLREEIRKFLSKIVYDQRDVKKHGLVRFLRTDSFKSEKLRIEKENGVVVLVQIEGDASENADEVGDQSSSSRSDATTKLEDYSVSTVSGKRIYLYTGDICRHNVDVIVTEVNEDLECAGDLAKHILDHAGMNLEEEREIYITKDKKLSAGNAMYTSSGNLTSCNHIIHAVVSPWPLQTQDTLAFRRVEMELESAVKSSLELASLLKSKTLACPAIGSGELGYPADLVAEQVLQTCINFLNKRVSSTLREIHIILPEVDNEGIRSFKDCMEREHTIVPKMAKTRSRAAEVADIKNIEKAVKGVERERLNISSTVSSVEEEVASVTVIATSQDVCQSVQMLLQDVFSSFCVSKCEDIQGPFKLDAEDRKNLEMLAARFGVALNLSVQSAQEATAQLTLSGFIEDVAKVQSLVSQPLQSLKEKACSSCEQSILERSHRSLKSDDSSPSDVQNACSRKQESVNNRRVSISKKGGNQAAANYEVSQETVDGLCQEGTESENIPKDEGLLTDVSSYSHVHRTKVSEKFQVNKTTFGVIEMKAKNDLESIESRFKVKIKKERCPNSPETAVLLSLESTNEHSDLERGFEKLRNVCVDIIRQGVSEVKIGLAPDEVALVKRMKQEELRVVLTVNDNVCTLYGLQEDIDEAHTKVKKTLEMSKTSFSPNDSLTFLLPTGQKVTVKKGDIVRQNVDVIVNAANRRLDHGEGVAAAICRAAGGSSFQEECRMLVRKIGEVKEGQAVYTGSGSLPFKIIVHAVAPHWSFVDNQSTQNKNFSLLRNACYSSLSVVQQKGATSVAIPGLGSGVFGFPKDVCAQALMNGTEDFFKKHTTSCIQRVVFVDIDDATVTAFMTEARKRYKLVSGSRPPPVIRDTKPKAEGMLTQLANAGRSLVTPWFGLGNSGSAEMEVRSEELCLICVDRKVNTTLKCNHSFCKKCIEEWAKQKATCPICSRPFGKVTGNQPLGGRMDVSKSYLSLPGYSGCGTIEIKYTIPSGTQGPEHPHPGVHYTGATRVAYLPNNKEGNELLGLLRKAFEARLVFTVGRSVTTSAENVVTWNDIHHKTRIDGGQTGYGYPDATYLSRLREDLRAKGIE
jgi:deltex-like protein